MTQCDKGRRRTLKILAAASGSLLTAKSALIHGAAPASFNWRGQALGARASLTLYQVDDVQGRRIVNRITDEVQRLEAVFSLYRADSALSRLNRRGFIEHPPLDLVRLLSEARIISEATEGAFDVSVQPLWKLYAGHFRTVGADVDGPAGASINSALARVGYKDIEIGSDLIRLNKTGMALTLNGIAQGYITDRIADLLYAAGLRQVLIDLGEIRALDMHPNGRPWNVGLRDPENSDAVTSTLDIDNQAVATSAGSGTRLDSKGDYHHIFDPRNGRPANIYRSITITGKRATQADALSTGLYSLQPRQARTVLKGFPGYSAHVINAYGSPEIWGTAT